MCVLCMEYTTWWVSIESNGIPEELVCRSMFGGPAGYSTVVSLLATTGVREQVALIVTGVGISNTNHQLIQPQLPPANLPT